MYRTVQMIHTSVSIESKALPAATGGGLVLEGITTTQRHAETAATVLHSVNDKKNMLRIPFALVYELFLSSHECYET